jgi:hypothetical protein
VRTQVNKHSLSVRDAAVVPVDVLLVRLQLLSQISSSAMVQWWLLGGGCGESVVRAGEQPLALSRKCCVKY